MSETLHAPTTVEEFLAWERLQDRRYEFDGKEIIDLDDDSPGHATMRNNLVRALEQRIDLERYRVFARNIKIKAAGSIRYPDVGVFSSDVRADAEIGSDPIVVFEILGDEEIANEIMAKNGEYHKTPCIQRYVMLFQSGPCATAFFRSGAYWGVDVVLDGGTLGLPELGIEIPVAEISEGVEGMTDDDTEA